MAYIHPNKKNTTKALAPGQCNNNNKSKQSYKYSIIKHGTFKN